MTAFLITAAELRSGTNLITLDGEHFIDGVNYPIRVRTLFADESGIDVLINPTRPLIEHFSVGSNTVNIEWVNCIDINPDTKGQFLVPIGALNGEIVVICENAKAQFFDMNDGSFIREVDMLLPKNLPSDITMSTSKMYISWSGYQSTAGVLAYAGYSLSPDNPYRILLRTATAYSEYLPESDFPLNYNIPLLIDPKVNRFGTHNMGTDYFFTTVNLSNVVQLNTLYIGDRIARRVDVLDTIYSPDTLPPNLPINFNTPPTDVQRFQFTGYKDNIAKLTASYSPYTNAWSGNDFGSTEVYSEYNQLHFTFDDRQVLMIDEIGEVDTIEFYSFYEIAGKIIAFSSFRKETPFIVNRRGIGVIVQATNGKYYFLSTQKGGNYLTSLPYETLAIYDCANYTRLL